MRFVDDVVSYGAIAIPAILLIGIGVWGCVLHLGRDRLAASLTITLLGTVLLVNASDKLHRIDPNPTLPIVAFIVIVVFWVRALTSGLEKTQQEHSDNSSSDLHLP